MKKINRIVIYLIGIFCLALGAVLAINTKLGVSAVSALPFNVSQVLNMGVGTASAIIYILYVVIQIIILKKEFKSIQLLQIVFAILLGQAINILATIIVLDAENMWIKLVIFVLSLLSTSLGIFLTISAKIVPVSPDGLVQVVSTKLKKDFATIKIYFDCVSVGLGAVITLVMGQGIGGIGIGTILAAILVGKIIHLMNKYLKTGLENLIFDIEEIQIKSVKESVIN